MSDTSSIEDPMEAGLQLKRKSTDAGLPSNGPRKNKSVKRRASKACQCCRTRKVRCNVVEQIPCTNCRLDEVECIVSESKRKKKWTKGDENGSMQPEYLDNAPIDTQLDGFGRAFSQTPSGSLKPSEHIPHALYQDLNSSMVDDSHRRHTLASVMPPTNLFNDLPNLAPAGSANFFPPQKLSQPPATPVLPAFIKPLPSRIGADDTAYLSKKGALTIPAPPLRNALLRCFAEFVYPFMPLLDFPEVLQSIDRNDGTDAVSLLVFQAIMFSAVATVSMKHLRNAGYATRRDARRDFFQKLRLLYDFDYEVDRISLIQSLLLMTYWYETPDDQKDSHHWMGIAVSLSHTIGLHRNPERSSMDPKRQRLWKRIWWSTYMRDRLIALGMRRPTRIKNEDFDVPMLTVDDFDIAPLAAGTMCMPMGCILMRDVSKQRELAVMCIEKAKLCICISHVLSAQYSVLHNNHGVQSKEGSTRTTMMLVARKDDPETCGVRTCDEELRHWKESIAAEAEYVDPTTRARTAGDECTILNRSLLHMVYYATLSALHRPQVLPSTAWPPQNTAAELLEISRANVRFAANQTTSIAETLSSLSLVKYLPTVGITVLLPAIIIHLLDIKAPDEATRRNSLQGFCQCMQIMSKLRDMYAAADYSTAFLEAAIRKAEITLPQAQKTAEMKEQGSNVVATAAGLVDAGKTLHLIPHDRHGRDHDASALTPPPEHAVHGGFTNSHHAESHGDLASRLETFLASTPPDSDSTGDDHLNQHSHFEPGHQQQGFNQFQYHYMQQAGDLMDMAAEDFEPDFDALVNLDAAGEAFALDASMPGECGAGAGGFAFEMPSLNMSWMRTPDEEPNLKDEGHIESATSMA